MSQVAIYAFLSAHSHSNHASNYHHHQLSIMQYALCNINMHYYQHTVMMFFNIIDRWGIICGLQNQNMKRGKYCYQHTTQSFQSFFKLSSDDQSYFKQIKTIFWCIHKGRLNDYQHHWSSRVTICDLKNHNISITNAYWLLILIHYFCWYPVLRTYIFIATVSN